MHIVVIEVLLIWIAFIVGVYQQHFQDLLRALWHPSLWRSAMKGMWNSKTFIAIAMLIGLSIGIYFLNSAQLQVTKEVEEVNKTEIINAINNAQQENSQKLQELIDIIKNNQD